MLCGLAASVLACASPGPPPAAPDASRLAELTRAIAGLDDSVPPAEAEHAAYEALQATAELGYAYAMTTPPQLHNLLVNAGIRERGLCCHWAEDLVARMLSLELESLEVHWVVASRGSLFREHSSVLLLANGQSFERGLVLDGWRNSGELVWANPAADRYAWEIHPLDGEWNDLHCRLRAGDTAEER
jgi:hypothetical protein